MNLSWLRGCDGDRNGSAIRRVKDEEQETLDTREAALVRLVHTNNGRQMGAWNL